LDLFFSVYYGGSSWVFWKEKEIALLGGFVPLCENFFDQVLNLI